MNMVRKLFSNFSFIWQFALDDFKNKYSNSFLGISWGFLQPMLTIVIYWFVFQIGFKSQPVQDFPFILWLVSGIIPWFFVSEAIPSSTSVLSEYSFLVQKVQFNINILPIVKTISTLLIQFVLIGFTLVLFALFGYYPSICYVQLLYYMTYMIILTIGISFICSALYVFVKDLIQVVSIVLQIIFWMTPIVWSIEIMPENVQKMLIYNPIYFVAQGYRNTLINQQPFWKDGLLMSLYYWGIALVLLFVGVKLFYKLKPHFADVL